MNMIEKVAITLCETRTWPGAWQQATDVEKDACRFEARAVIEAMREPTPEMLAAGDDNVCISEDLRYVFAAMIDAALEEN